MKKKIVMIILLGFILSGFTYLQSTDTTDKIDRSNQILIANYAKISGLKERLVAIKRLSEINKMNENEFAEKLDNINQQLKMIIYDSKKVYDKTIELADKKYSGKINIFKWLRLYELKDNYKNIGFVHSQIVALQKKEDSKSINIEDNLVNKLLKYFKSTKETRQIHLVYNEKENSNKAPITYLKPVLSKPKTKINRNIKDIEHRNIKACLDKPVKNIQLSESINKKMLKDSKILFEIENNKGKFEYVSVKSNDNDLDNYSFKNDYIYLRVKDALKGEMYRVDRNIKKTDQMQEITYKDIRYKYSPKLNKYIRKIDDDFEMACDNIVFQMIKSEHGSKSFQPDAIGFGNAMAFSAGKTIKGVWLKESPDKSIKFYDTEGNEISLLPGRTIVVVLPEEEAVSCHYF